MNLRELLDLLEKQGITGDKAERIAAEYIRKQESGESGSIERRHQDAVQFPTSPQGDGRRPVDYGHETPAEAKERWMRQEMSDPGGIFGMGGQSAGGIFGGGAIPTDSYDPEAMHRGVAVAAQHAQAQASIKQLEVMERMERQLKERERQERPERQQLPTTQHIMGRLLGRRTKK